ncbi:cytochrome c-type biogenesis protein CcmH [Alteromonas sp. LMIT006]|uniref:cytochrome c-type biogenesis protein n=1 Tax=Alteromonadaceae TaxID=72275 RepID=UPI0020CA7268|nr:cytochrome c-type biogenesis protein [Alteromonas sp. LMIT006]UTP72615.1 cytochrome c-type biogenesis protein CcmH [Alteromonas sp. LMIT006]
MKYMVVALFLLLSSSSFAAQENYQFDTPEQQALFKELTATLRCPMCQNQNIADSDAMIAHDMRRKVYQLITQGQDHDQVVAFMKSRYGDFVYYQPPVTRTTIWLWLLPIFVVLLGIVVILRRKPNKLTAQDEQAALAKAQALLDEDK